MPRGGAKRKKFCETRKYFWTIAITRFHLSNPMQKNSKAQNEESTKRLDPKFRRLIYSCLFVVLCLGGLFYLLPSGEEAVLTAAGTNTRTQDATLDSLRPAMPLLLGESAGPLPDAEPDLSAPAPPGGDQASNAMPDGGWAPVHTPRTREIGGLKAEAFVGGAKRPLVPNQLGLFPRQPIGVGQTISVRVRFPGSAEGDQVVVQADDGGLIDLESVVARKVLDERGVLEFRFTSTLEGGVYRITLGNGFDEKRLEFWGGSEPGGAVTAAVP